MLSSIQSNRWRPILTVLKLWTRGEMSLFVGIIMDRQTDRQIDIQTNKKTYTQTDIWTYKKKHGQTDKQTDRQTDGQVDLVTDSL